MSFLGGQRRTYMCDCGWGTKDSVRAANMKYKLHQKVCPNGNRQMAPPAFNPAMNGFNGINVSRRGNLQHIPLVTAVVDENGVIGVADMGVAMEVKEEKKQ
jgi:hypothetical protein